MVKVGSNWGSDTGTIFTVLHRIELDGKIWIHYRNQQGKEFSCYEEAFLIRFREHANEKR